MNPNHIPITQNQLDRIYSSSGWGITEISLEELKVIPRIVWPDDHLGAFASGCLEQTKKLNGYNSIAAFEVLVHEKNPKPEWNEWNVNAYHYIIRESGHSDYLYILSGPYTRDTIIGHHPSNLNLEVYEQNQAEPNEGGKGIRRATSWRSKKSISHLSLKDRPSAFSKIV